MILGFVKSYKLRELTINKSGKIFFMPKETQYVRTKLFCKQTLKHKRILEMHGPKNFLTIWNRRAYWMRNEQNLHLLAKNAIDHKYQQLSWNEWKLQFVLLELHMEVKTININYQLKNILNIQVYKLQ